MRFSNVVFIKVHCAHFVDLGIGTTEEMMTDQTTLSELPETVQYKTRATAMSTERATELSIDLSSDRTIEIRIETLTFNTFSDSGLKGTTGRVFKQV